MMQISKQISARIYPNGEFGVGYCSPSKKSAKERIYDKECRYAEDNAEIHPCIKISADGESFTYGREIIPGYPPPKLGIGSESSRASRKYGLNGITSYARKMVRNGGHLLDKRYKGKYGSFLKMATVTLPSYSPETMRRIAMHWGDIVRKFFQKMKRHHAKKNYPFNYVAVTEIQPRRLEQRGEVGLHIHFLYRAIRDRAGGWILPYSVLRQKWDATINHYLEENEELQPSNFRSEGVHSSSASYLAKYMSKGDETVAKVAEEFGEEYLPSQWWSMDSATRHCIKVHTISSTDELAYRLLVISRWGVSDYVRYIRVATLRTNANQYAKEHGCPAEIILGYGGLLSPDGYSLFSPPCQDESIYYYLPSTLDK
jgi:hypothetical protein